MRRWYFFLFVLICVVSVVAEPLTMAFAGGQGASNVSMVQTREIQGNLTRIKLTNGLTVIIEEHPISPVVTVLTFVKGGYGREAHVGVSHLLERLYTNHSQVIQDMGKLGAVVDVSTDYFGHSFVSSVPAKNVLKILGHHADLLKAPRIDPIGISQEVQALLAQQQDDLGSFPNIDVPESLHGLRDHSGRIGNTPYVEGVSAMLNTDFALGQLSDFRESFYHPGNSVLVVSGAVRRETILATVVELYGSIQSAANGVGISTIDSSQDTSISPGFQYRHLRGNTQRPQIIFSYLLPGPQHEDYLACVLISYLLGKGRGGLLKQAVLGLEGSALDVQVRFEDTGYQAILALVVNPAPGKVDQAEVQVLAQLEALKQRGVPTGELDRAKAMLLKDHYKGLQSLDRRARLLAKHEILGLYSDRDLLPKLLTQITHQDINRVLDHYLKDSNLALLEYFPEDAESRHFDSKTILETLRLLVGTVLNDAVGVLDSIHVTSDESTFELPEFTTSYSTQKLKYTSVLRGPKIYFHEEHFIPLVNLGFFYFGGRINETSQNAGITQLLLLSLLHHAISDKQSAIFSQLERLGAEVEIINELDFFGFQTTVVSTHLEQVFGILLDWSRLTDLQEEDLELARREVLVLQAQESANALEMSLQAAYKEVFGGYAYGLPRSGTPKTVHQITLKDLEHWRSNHIHEIHPLIVVQGDVEGTSFLSNFVSKLSDADYSSREPVKKLFTEPEKEYESYVDRLGKGPHGQFVMGFKGPAIGTKANAALDVLEVVLLGPTGDLSRSLRNQGWVGDLEMFREVGLNGGSILICLEDIGKNSEAVQDILFAQLTKWGSVPLREQEFLRAVVGAITHFHIHRQFGDKYLIQLVSHMAAGQGVDFWNRYLMILRNLRREDVVSMARKFLGAEEGVEGRQKLQDGGRNYEEKRPVIQAPSLHRAR